MGVSLHSYTCACWGQIPKFGWLGLQMSPSNMMASCLETANHRTLFYRSILYAFDLFEPLHMLWMGIWMHPYHTQLHLCMWGPNSNIWKIGAKGEPKYVNNPSLYFRSILNVSEVFEPFGMLWIGWACACSLTQLHLCMWGVYSKIWIIGATGEPK